MLRVEAFFADLRLRFEAESAHAVGDALRRLQHAARDCGFELTEGKVVPARKKDDRSEGGTPYAPVALSGE